MKLDARRVLLGMIATVLLAAPIIHLHETPILDRLPGGYWLFLQGSCPATRIAAERVRGDADLDVQVLLIPTDAVSEHHCAAFSEQLLRRGHWLVVIPRSYLCDRVGREAQHFVELHHVGSPAWAFQGRALGPDEDPFLELD
jgi:hypothetical protein